MFRFTCYLVGIFAIGCLCAFFQETGRDVLAFVCVIGIPLGLYAAILMKAFRSKKTADRVRKM